MPKPHWSAQEDAIIRQYAGDVPPSRIYGLYSRAARRLGLRVRTVAAVNNRISILGLSKLPSGRWLHSALICDLLGISRNRFNGWLKRHPVEGMIIRGKRRYVTRRDFTTWAKQHPHLFHGIERMDLFALFEDEDLCDHLIASAWRPSKPCRLDDGRTFPSMEACGAAIFCNGRSLSSAMCRQKKRADVPIAGHTFSLI